MGEGPGSKDVTARGSVTAIRGRALLALLLSGMLLVNTVGVSAAAYLVDESAGDDELSSGHHQIPSSDHAKGGSEDSKSNGANQGKGPAVNPGNGPDENPGKGHDDAKPGNGPTENSGKNPNRPGEATGRANTNNSERGTSNNASTHPGNGRGPVVTVNHSRGRTNGQRADFSVTNAKANETVSVNLTENGRERGQGPSKSDASPSNRSRVNVDRLDVTVTRDGNYTMNVTASDTRIDDAPAFDVGDGSEAAGYIRVDHSVPDRDIDGVNFTFRLDKSRLAELNAAPEAVALYRYHDGAWAELETAVQNETAGEYVFVAVSPGLSDFTTGVKRPKFEMEQPLVGVDSARLGDDVDVEVMIHNVGGADGPFLAELVFNDAVVDEQRITIAAHGSRKLHFEQTLGQTGTYEIYVNQILAGTVSVDSTTDTEESDIDESVDSIDTTRTTSPGFGAGAVLVAFLVCGGVLCSRFRSV